MYMPEKYKEEIPFVAPAPIDEAEAKKAKKGGEKKVTGTAAEKKEPDKKESGGRK